MTRLRDNALSPEGFAIEIGWMKLITGLALFIVLVPLPGRSGSNFSTGLLAEGTSHETPWYRIEADSPGPTFLLTGGIHGNEPAGAFAAEQIRHWPVKMGTLIVIPAVNQSALENKTRRFPGLEGDRGDLNRHFPRSGEPEETRSPLAAAVWQFVKKQKPDWVVDLHEGFAVNRKNPDSVGSTILCYPGKDTLPVFEDAIVSVNATIDDPENFFRLLSRSRTANGSLVRASMERLGATGAIFETTYKGFPLGVRIRQHRLMVWRTLRSLDMIGNGVDDLVPGLGSVSKTAIGIYLGPGAGGNGPLALKETFDSQPERFLTRIIGPHEVRNGSLDQFDLVIFPGGSGSKQAAAIGEKGRENVRQFVREGGGYIGICAGCYLACENFPWSLKILDAKTKSSKWRRGKKELQLGFTDEGLSLFDRKNSDAMVKYQNGPVMAPAGSPRIPDFTTLAIFKTEVALNDSPKGIQVGSPAILRGGFGQGRVVGVSPHPEQTEGLTDLVPALVQWCIEDLPKQ